MKSIKNLTPEQIDELDGNLLELTAFVTLDGVDYQLPGCLFFGDTRADTEFEPYDHGHAMKRPGRPWQFGSFTPALIATLLPLALAALCDEFSIPA